MQAKQNHPCAYKLCPHGSMILQGQEITWNRRANTGERYHVDCFVAVKGLSSYAPAKRDEGKAVSFTVDSFGEIELIEETVAVSSPKMRHYLYPLLKHYVDVRQHCYLWGAPGSGKSHVARDIAKELGLEFSFVSVNPQSPASLLLGYMDAHGIYRESELFKRWRDGGVFLFDEQDNCSSSLLTILNGMLSSSEGSFPFGMCPRHPDFIFVGTGNTTGRGGDWQFPERRKIDEASIDRLAFLPWGYDEALEMFLAAGVDAQRAEISFSKREVSESKKVAWVQWIQAVRRYCSDKANGVKGGIYATPRSSMGVVKDLCYLGSSLFSSAEIAERHVFKGADKDLVSRIVANCPLPR